ncbi:hypothetical protein DPSP01_009491 [Paraphaeosphaeria sporulosa]
MLLPRTVFESWHIKAMKASSFPVHRFALLLSSQPDRVILFIIMRFSVIALAALLGTAYALPLVAEGPEDAVLRTPLTLRSAEPEAIPEADPKKHKHHQKGKDGKKKDHAARDASADPEAEAKKHHHKLGKDKHHKDKGTNTARGEKHDGKAAKSADKAAKHNEKAGKHDDKGKKHDGKGGKHEKGEKKGGKNPRDADPKKKHKEHHHKENHKEEKGKGNNP